MRSGRPVLPLVLGREIAADHDEIDRGGEAGFAEVKELLVGGEGGIVRGGRERRRPVSSKFEQAVVGRASPLRTLQRPNGRNGGGFNQGAKTQSRCREGREGKAGPNTSALRAHRKHARDRRKSGRPAGHSVAQPLGKRCPPPGSRDPRLQHGPASGLHARRGTRRTLSTNRSRPLSRRVLNSARISGPLADKLRTADERRAS